jgi:transposase
MIGQVNEWIDELEEKKAALLAHILEAIKAQADLKTRWDLLQSLPGVGPVVAATLVIRMPELGAMDKGQAASLAGVAPFDRKSGQWQGQSFICGGRGRVRRMLYMAAMQARKCSPPLKAFAERLAAKGKAGKVVLVAVMRKLIEAANLVLKRGAAWTKEPA